MYQAIHPTERHEYWTLEGLASWFEISPATVRKYIQWKLIPPAIGKFPGGLNYDHTHFDSLKRVRDEVERRVPLSERRTSPHCPVRQPRQVTA